MGLLSNFLLGKGQECHHNVTANDGNCKGSYLKMTFFQGGELVI